MKLKVLNSMYLCAFLITIFLPAQALAQWNLDKEQSYLTYTSIKKGNVGEPNHFQSISGSVSEDGAAKIEISMDSIETNIDVRNERVKNSLFKVSEFPMATVTADIDMNDFSTLAVGKSTHADLFITLSMLGLQNDYDASVNVYRISDNQVLVSTRDQIIIDARDYDMTGGLDALKKVANLTSIEPIVPVSFSLLFKK